MPPRILAGRRSGLASAAARGPAAQISSGPAGGARRTRPRRGRLRPRHLLLLSPASPPAGVPSARGACSSRRRPLRPRRLLLPPSSPSPAVPAPPTVVASSACLLGAAGSPPPRGLPATGRSFKRGPPSGFSGGTGAQRRGGGRSASGGTVIIKIAKHFAYLDKDSPLSSLGNNPAREIIEA
ncbi:hypothetical protein U9M48_009640 [Paspalum notatum var. saurae]|uniref:Uncharacterized protein n=1 Tax=Paspalum notatum var. saurae TaxID=547442 RepID=A0AAQ3ST17_PASNO